MLSKVVIGAIAIIFSGSVFAGNAETCDRSVKIADVAKATKSEMAYAITKQMKVQSICDMGLSRLAQEARVMSRFQLIRPAMNATEMQLHLAISQLAQEGKIIAAIELSKASYLLYKGLLSSSDMVVLQEATQPTMEDAAYAEMLTKLESMVVLTGAKGAMLNLIRSGASAAIYKDQIAINAINGFIKKSNDTAMKNKAASLFIEAGRLIDAFTKDNPSTYEHED